MNFYNRTDGLRLLSCQPNLNLYFLYIIPGTVLNFFFLFFLCVIIQVCLATTLLYVDPKENFSQEESVKCCLGFPSHSTDTS